MGNMSYSHKELASGRWRELSFFDQMANVGSEIGRTITWKMKKNQDYERLAFDRALELLDLTIEDSKNRSRLREIVRVREALADFFVFDNVYKSTDRLWQNYFYAFTYAARVQK
jgi:hypothetical protein